MVRWQSDYAADCKSVLDRFDSYSDLQNSPLLTAYNEISCQQSTDPRFVRLCDEQSNTIFYKENGMAIIVIIVIFVILYTVLRKY